MKSTMLKLAILAMVPAIMLSFACSKKEPVKGRATSNEPGATGMTSGQPEAIAVETMSKSWTVDSVDMAARTLTVKDADGTSHTFNVGKEVANFDQIKAGDKINAKYIEAVAVSVRKADQPPSAGETTTVTLAPKGAKPGMVMADTFEVTSKITSVDAKTHMLTIEGAAGKTRSMKVSPNADLSNLKTGDDVVVRYTQALVVEVEK